SSQFADELRDMRAQARDLARQQDELVKQMDQQANVKKLSDAGEGQSVLDQLARQRERLTNLVERATQISQDAETSEPLLSRQLYDTLRQFSQETGKDLKEIQEKLLNSGLMTRDLDERLRAASEQNGAKLLDITSEMLRLNFLPPAMDTARQTRGSIENLKQSVERATESMVGDDTESLRLAGQQLDQLTEQLTREIAQNDGSGTNRSAGGAAGRNPQRGDTNGVQVAQGSSNSGPRGNNDGQNPGSANAQPGQNDSQNEGNQPGANGQPGNEAQTAQAGQGNGRGNRRGGQRGGNQPGENQPGG